MWKMFHWLHARYRAAYWVSCFVSPRPDVLAGFARWRQLAAWRKAGRLVEPTVRVFGNLINLSSRLHLGKGAMLDHSARIWLGALEGRIKIADGAYIGPSVYLGVWDHRLEVGVNSMIGGGSYLITDNHDTTKKHIPYMHQGYIGSDIIIGSNVWLGCHVVVLPGVVIGDGAVVGAGAVVTKNIPAGEKWAGVPAKRMNAAK
jgi:acetyltransferase-like isoleucine patch superfamily enzyme